jgi:hypothetical protein
MVMARQVDPFLVDEITGDRLFHVRSSEQNTEGMSGWDAA